MGFNQRNNVIKHTIFDLFSFETVAATAPATSRTDVVVDAFAANKRIFRSLESACATQAKIDDELMTMSCHTRTTNVDRLFSASLLAFGRALL